jgi:hypothetical protein
MEATTTDKAPVVTLETLVSICVGSDQYAGRVTKVTRSTVTVAFKDSGGLNGKEYIFKPRKNHWRAARVYVLLLGESATKLDADR